MVIYSNEIKEFLDKIYFYELSHRNDWNTPLYNYYEGNKYDIEIKEYYIDKIYEI